MYAMDQRASLNSDQIDGIKNKMKTLTPIKIPGQDIAKFATQARELKVELDKLYAYEHTITKKILWNLSQVTVDRFRISVYTLMDQIEPKLQEIKTLSYTDAEFHMIAEHLDLEFILTKYEAMYKSMVTSGEWAPARNKIDKNVPEVNQVEVDKSKKDQEYKRHTDKKTDPKDKDKKNTCYTCGQEGHISPKCRNKDAPVVDKLPDPQAEGALKVVKYKDKCKFLCTKCKRYMATHLTEQHTAPKKNKDDTDNKANKAPTNSEANKVAYDGVPTWAPWSA
jgi:Zinc knuckle